ncbi:MAG TPA: SGNH/GDSL hydrolase family protein [Aggregatilineales bacterium]|nr:SGNH/GDSL hydrolase family protein [Aggregatilineales bacterium]
MTIITPYDNKVAVWHHAGSAVVEQTIDQLALSIRRYAPAVSQVWVKTSDGSDWMATYDNKPGMAIDGPAAIQTWVRTLQRYGLEFHAWCVPRGLNVDAEAKVILQACQVPGVRSMVLDVEPYNGFFQGPREAVRALMLKVRTGLPSAYHIGMAVDPRPSHYNEIYPDEWFPFVNSVHLQLYWGTFQQTPDKTLASGYSTWSKYNRPLFPILQGYAVTPTTMDQARTLAVNAYKSVGVSWWVLGQIDPAHFVPINRYVDGTAGNVPPGADGSALNYGPSITVAVGGPGYADGAYQGVQPPLNQFTSIVAGKYHPTNDGVANVFARWDGHIQVSGWYQIDAYVPSQHATTGRARYKLHGIKGQRNIDEVIASLPQMLYNDEWAPIGTFEVDATAKEPGIVYLNDWTFEPKLEIAFSAIRWTPILGVVATPAVISNITPFARQILQNGLKLGNRANVFVRVGDSISYSPNFLTPIGQGQVNLGSYGSLAPTIQFFSAANVRGAGNSFVNPPLAAGNGWGADRILQAGVAYSDVCGSDTQLVCEYKHSKPGVALIMIGTNDSGGVPPDVYAGNLRQIVRISINMGVIPVVSTIPPKRLAAWDTARVNEWNAIIREIAQQYQIPLWDYFTAMQNLPNQGLGPDGIHPSVPPDNATGNFTNLNYGYTMRNLTALQVLDALRRQVLS